MELLLGLIVLVVVGYFVFRPKAKVEEKAQESAVPYKVEAPVAEAPKAEEAPAKKPRAKKPAAAKTTAAKKPRAKKTTTK